jgi:hypothetical protein
MGHAVLELMYRYSLLELLRCSPGHPVLRADWRAVARAAVSGVQVSVLCLPVLVCLSDFGRFSAPSTMPLCRSQASMVQFLQTVVWPLDGLARRQLALIGVRQHGVLINLLKTINQPGYKSYAGNDCGALAALGAPYARGAQLVQPGSSLGCWWGSLLRTTTVPGCRFLSR